MVRYNRQALIYYKGLLLYLGLKIGFCPIGDGGSVAGRGHLMLLKDGEMRVGGRRRRNRRRPQLRPEFDIARLLNRPVVGQLSDGRNVRIAGRGRRRWKAASWPRRRRWGIYSQSGKMTLLYTVSAGFNESIGTKPITVSARFNESVGTKPIFR